MTKPVRWGVLGASNFALQHMAPAIHAAKGAELAAIATSSAAKAAPFQSFCPTLQVYEDYDALLADPSIDAVYIPLPNHLHVEWTRRAAEAGKHVLCEKPMAMAAEEIDTLIDLRDKTGLLLTEAYMIVHHPQWQRARQLIADGAIGNLIHVDCVFSFDNRADGSNIRNRPETGGGALRDIGVYAIGSTRFATAKEPQVVAANITWENEVDVISRVVAQFPGFSYTCVVSMRMFPRQEITFHGDAGVLKLTAPFNANVFNQAELHLHQPDFAVRTERFPGVNQYVLQVENFSKTVRTGADYPWKLEDAKGTQAVLDRVFKAAQ